jgi:YD repeat-containing protein
VRLDRLLLTTDTTFIPTGAGPAESPRASESLLALMAPLSGQEETLLAARQESRGSGEMLLPRTPAPLHPGAPTMLPQLQAGSADTITTTYTYDDLSRLTAVDYSTGESFAYAYDPMGNQTAITETVDLSDTVVTTYTYNAANQLVHQGINKPTVQSR